MEHQTPAFEIIADQLPLDWQECEAVLLMAFLQPHSSSEQYVRNHLLTVASHYGDRVLVRHINTETAPELLAQFRISCPPTLLLLRKGEILDQLCGIFTLEKLTGLVDLHSPWRMGDGPENSHTLQSL